MPDTIPSIAMGARPDRAFGYAPPVGAQRARVAALATAVPPHRMEQREVEAVVRRLFAGRKLSAGHRFDFERLAPVFANAAIETRYSCVPLEFHLRPSSFAERNALYVENAVALMERVASDLLRDTGLDVGDIDAIVAVSSTGIATPSLDALIMERMGFRRDTQRLPVFGLGCAGGVGGIARAAQLAMGRPGARIMLLVVELCGLTFRQHDTAKSNLIAAALFGDGAAGAIIGCELDGPAVAGWGEYTWPDSLGVMGWDVRDDGLGVIFSRDIPGIVQSEFPYIIDAYMDSFALDLGDVDGFAIHPGGAKVIAAFEQALRLEEGALAHARAVLRDYGNMSAVTALFVLQAMWRDGLTGRHLLSALGPGFTASLAHLEHG